MKHSTFDILAGAGGVTMTTRVARDAGELVVNELVPGWAPDFVTHGVRLGTAFAAWFGNRWVGRHLGGGVGEGWDVANVINLTNGVSRFLEGLGSRGNANLPVEPMDLTTFARQDEQPGMPPPFMSRGPVFGARFPQ